MGGVKLAVLETEFKVQLFLSLEEDNDEVPREEVVLYETGSDALMDRPTDEVRLELP